MVNAGVRTGLPAELTLPAASVSVIVSCSPEHGGFVVQPALLTVQEQENAVPPQLQLPEPLVSLVVMIAFCNGIDSPVLAVPVKTRC